MKEVKYPDLAALLQGAKSQRTIAEACGVSQPSVQAWLAGRSRPEKSRIAFLAAKLGLEPEALAKAAGYTGQIPTLQPDAEQLKRDGGLLEFVGGMVTRINTANDSGLPGLASDLCESSFGQLKYADLASDHALSAKLRAVAADLVTTHGRIICESLPVGAAVERMQHLDTRLDELARADPGSELHGLQLTNQACMEYISGRQRRSLKLNLMALDCVENGPWRLEILRAIVISVASLKDKSALGKYAKQLRQLVDTIGQDDLLGASFGYE